MLSISYHQYLASRHHGMVQWCFQLSWALFFCCGFSSLKHINMTVPSLILFNGSVALSTTYSSEVCSVHPPTWSQGFGPVSSVFQLLWSMVFHLALCTQCTTANRLAKLYDVLIARHTRYGANVFINPFLWLMHSSDVGTYHLLGLCSNPVHLCSCSSSCQALQRVPNTDTYIQHTSSCMAHCLSPWCCQRCHYSTVLLTSFYQPWSSTEPASGDIQWSLLHLHVNWSLLLFLRRCWLPVFSNHLISQPHLLLSLSQTPTMAALC